MNSQKTFKLFIIPFLVLFMFTGCSSKKDKQTFDEKMWQIYKESGRLDKFNEIQKEYDGNKIILWLNDKEDHSWLVNHTIYWLSWILPDPPTVLATGGVLAIIYGLGWLLGLALTGGGILGLLAYVGRLLGGVPGIPPAIMGIIFFGVLFEILVKIFNSF